MTLYTEREIERERKRETNRDRKRDREKERVGTVNSLVSFNVVLSFL